MLPDRKWKQPTVLLKLIHHESAKRAGRWAHGQGPVQYGCTSSSRQRSSGVGCGKSQFRCHCCAHRAAQTRNLRAIALRSQPACNGLLSCRRSEIVAPVDLEFLHRILAYVQAHTTRIVVCLASIDGYVVAPSVAPVEREAALRGLLHSKIGVVGNSVGITHAWH